MDKHQIYKAIYEKKGLSHQATVCIEECSELTKELTKLLRNKLSKMHLAEEMADVYLCIDSLMSVYNMRDQVELFYQFKMKRLQKFYIEGDEV